MTMEKKERLISLPLFVLFALAYYYSRKFPIVPRMLPTILSLFGMILCTCVFIRTFTNSGVAGGQKNLDGSGARKVAFAVLLVCAYIFCLKIIGFYVSSFLFINLFSYLIDARKYALWLYPAVAAGLLAIIYLIFGLFLHVLLPKGLLF